MGPKTFIRLSLLLLVVSLLGCSKPRTVVVTPKEIDEVLVNPGMGFTTFYSFNGDEINRNHPACSIAYYRWYWDVMEPEEGKANFVRMSSEDLVAALNALGATPRDIVAIFQALDAAGALQAQLVII